MEDKNTVLVFCLSPLMGIVIYSLCVFAFVDEYSDRFLISYVFTIVAFLAQMVAPLILYFDKEAKKEGFLGISLYIPGSFYLILQLSVGIGLMILPVPFRIAFTIEAVIFAGFIFIIIAIETGREHIKKSKFNIENSIEFMKNLSLQAEDLYNKVEDTKRKAELKKMWETIKYSDPVSKEESIHLINEQIAEAFRNVCCNLELKTPEELSKEVKAVINLVNRRNSVCKAKK